MCKPKKPNVQAQQAEAARQAQAEEAHYQQSLAAQQAEWERQRVDAERRHQEQLTLMNGEIARQQQQQQEQNTAAEKLRQDEIDRAKASATRGRSYADYRDASVQAGVDNVNGAFAGFDDAYFNNFAGQFVDANRGDVDREHERGKRSMKYKLADNRNLNSSAAADAFGEMDEDHNSAIAKIAATGSQKAAAYKNAVAGQKANATNSLYQLGNMDVPDFQTDEDATAAKSRFAKAIMDMTSNVTVPSYV